MLRKRSQAYATRDQNRQIENKQKVLKSVIDSSYFGAEVVKNSNEEKKFKVAITLNDSSDGDKTISSFFKDEIKIGDIIYWIKTNTYWLVTNQEYGEIAFFQGRLEQCENYQIIGPDGKTKVFANIKVEPDTKVDKFNDSTMKFDTTTIVIKVPDNKVNNSLFKIESCIQIKGFTYRINNIDNISTDGIIVIYAKRDFDNNPTLFVEKEKIENDNDYIVGPKEIVPLEEAIYTVSSEIEGTWVISDNTNILKTINNDNSLKIIWKNTRKRNNFTISYGEYSKEIIVKSLF